MRPCTRTSGGPSPSWRWLTATSPNADDATCRRRSGSSKKRWGRRGVGGRSTKRPRRKGRLDGERIPRLYTRASLVALAVVVAERGEEIDAVEAIFEAAVRVGPHAVHAAAFETAVRTERRLGHAGAA